MGAPGDGESGMGTKVPPGDLGQQGTGDSQIGHGVSQGTGDRRTGHGVPQGIAEQSMRCSRALGTARRAPTSFQGMEDSRRGPRGQLDKISLGNTGQQDGHQCPSRGERTLG